jgi:hypothetical protein
MNSEPSGTQLETESQAEEEQMRLEMDRLDQFLPRNELVLLPVAFEFAKDIASRRGVPGYKTERALTRALSRENLITTQLGPANNKTHDEWRDELHKSEGIGFPPVEEHEVTSKRAIEELFERNAARRRQLDRERKKKLRVKATAPNEEFKNLSGKTESEEQTDASKKRTSNRKKRTR